VRPFVRFGTFSVALGILAVLSSGVPAAATVERLCVGYAACAQAGMSHAGYRGASDAMYWRMYAGHNCTNYAAYRMVLGGLPNERPWSGGGNATYWGSSMSEITDRTPAVGSVAWWRAGVYPAGSAGHVAYVERVVSADEIIVSQDSWGGDFSWARVTRSRGWPSGFIHFHDVPLDNTAPPTLTGTPRVGSVLQASAGTWSVPEVATAFQWRVGGVVVPGAGGHTLSLTEDMLGKRVRVAVTASRLGYPTTVAASPATAPVQVGRIQSTSPPTVSGEPRVDATLTANAGLWNTTPDAVAYQWRADGRAVPGAVGASYVPGPDLVGRALSLTVTARKSGYADVAVTSAATAPVGPGTLQVTGTPELDGTSRPGSTVRLTSVPTASGATAAVQWLRGGQPVEGAQGVSYAVTAADLSARLRARVTLTRPGYTTVVATTTSTSRVRWGSTLEVSVRPGAGRLSVSGRASAAGSPLAAGTVRVWTAGVLRGEVPVRGGVVRGRVEGLPPGPQRVRLVLRHTPTTAAQAAVSRVVVRPIDG
jgi:surface antigen